MSYQDVKDRLYRGHKKIANNTYLTLYEGNSSYPYQEAIKMRLHGNTVTIFTQEFIELYSAGWHTLTTKNRLNLALDLAKIYGQRIYQDNWQWYYWHYNHSRLPSTRFYDGMKIDYTGKVLN